MGYSPLLVFFTNKHTHEQDRQAKPAWPTHSHFGLHLLESDWDFVVHITDAKVPAAERAQACW